MKGNVWKKDDVRPFSKLEIKLQQMFKNQLVQGSICWTQIILKHLDKTLLLHKSIENLSMQGIVALLVNFKINMEI